jgi:hypothetical protein
MLQQALAGLGLLVVLVMAADMLLVALQQTGWLARWARALQSTPQEDRARARRREALRLQRSALLHAAVTPNSVGLWEPAGRHNQT